MHACVRAFCHVLLEKKRKLFQFVCGLVVFYIAYVRVKRMTSRSWWLILSEYTVKNRQDAEVFVIEGTTNSCQFYFPRL